MILDGKVTEQGTVYGLVADEPETPAPAAKAVKPKQATRKK